MVREKETEMAKREPGKAYRPGLSIIDITRKFPDEETVLEWFEEQRWPKGPFCPKCGTFNVQSGIKSKTSTFAVSARTVRF